MTNVGIIFDAHFNGITYKYTLYPLVKWHKNLKEHGINVQFFTDESSPGILKCDIVIILNSYFGNNLTLHYKHLDVLISLKRKVPKLIFFDITDSCGTTKFETIDIVDTYIKRQLYKDKTLYMRNIFGTRSFCEYYVSTIPDVKKDCNYNIPTLKPNQLSKLKLGWNIGIGDYFSSKKIFRNFNGLYCNNYLRIGHIIDQLLFSSLIPNLSWQDKNIDISYRGAMEYSIDAISYSRSKVNDILDKLTNKYLIKYRSRIKKKYFIDELVKSKIVISPFGYGEICFRDFEAFQTNSCLLKPDMSHLETWPNYYVSGSTYISYKWDFSDIEENIDLLMSDDYGKNIAMNGHEYFLSNFSQNGIDSFCEHFKSIIM